MHRVQVFPTQDTLANHSHQTHKMTEKGLAQLTRKVAFKVIIDLYLGASKKDPFIEDGQCEVKVPSLNKYSLTPSMTQMYSQQLKQQRNALKYHDQFRARTIEIQCKMDEVSNDSTLPEDVKILRYNNLPEAYKFAMLKSTQSINPLLHLPVHHNKNN